MYQMIVIGAGPAGISMAVEARNAGVPADGLLVLEKAEEHSFTLKKYYPDNKLVTANYKGFEAVCTGVMCMPDLSKHQTISYLDSSLLEHDVHVRYRETVHKIFKHEGEQRFTINTDRGDYQTAVVVIAIGILGKPNKPEYPLPRTLKDRLLFDVTTTELAGANILVVGGGDSASEYCQYLVQKGNRVSLSYRRSEFARMNDINRASILALAHRGNVELLLGSNISQVVDASGKPQVVFREEALGTRPFDFLIYALGGSTPENFLKTIGIEFNGDAPRLLEAHETTVPGLFALGNACYNGSGIPGAVPAAPGRMRGSGLTGAVWMGIRAGESALAHATSASDAQVDPSQAEVLKSVLYAPIRRTVGEDPTEVLRSIQAAFCPIGYSG
jgi:thioredoxin reductase (NADPH)